MYDRFKISRYSAGKRQTELIFRKSFELIHAKRDSLSQESDSKFIFSSYRLIMLDTRGRSVNIVMYIPLEYFIISYYTEYIMKCEQLPSPRASVRLQSIRRWRSG